MIFYALPDPNGHYRIAGIDVHPGQVVVLGAVGEAHYIRFDPVDRLDEFRGATEYRGEDYVHFYTLDPVGADHCIRVRLKNGEMMNHQEFKASGLSRSEIAWSTTGCVMLKVPEA